MRICALAAKDMSKEGLLDLAAPLVSPSLPHDCPSLTRQLESRAMTDHEHVRL